MIKQSDIDRFNSKIEKLENGCWIFTGCKNYKGYGFTRFNTKNIGAHRFSWLIHNGSIPDGLLVCHTCDVRDCVNILHLWLGTPKQNTQDMVKKDRPRGPKNAPRGENSATSKITNEQALQITKLIELRKTTPEISKELNISKPIIDSIRCKKSWTYLEFKKPEPIKFFKNCLVCNTEFRTRPYKIKTNKFCSHKCYSISLEKPKRIKKPKNKLTEENILEIRKLLKTDMIHREIAEKFNVRRQCISKIKLGIRWKHVQ